MQYYDIVHANMKIRNMLSEVKQHLNEMEISYYKNLHLNMLTNKMAAEICDIYKRMKTKDDFFQTYPDFKNATIQEYVNGKLGSEWQCVLLKYNVATVSWLKQVKICVTFDVDADESAVLADTEAYIKDADEKYVKKNVEYKIKSNYDSNEMLYLLDDKCVRTATILLYFEPDSTHLSNTRELSSILFHELSHIYDMFKDNKTQADINRDIINSNKTSLVYNEYELNQIYENPYEGITNANADLIQAFVYSELIYITNESELTARLCNFVREIDDFKRKDFEEHKENIQEFLFKVSYTYNLMSQMKRYCNMFIAYTQKDVKEQYVRKFIINLFDKPLDNGELMFGRNFKVNGIYSSKSFDALMKFFIERLERFFFDRALQIVEYTKDAINEIYYHEMFCATLQKDTFNHPRAKKASDKRRLVVEGYKLGDIEEYRNKVFWAFV